jgi:hypothetical protein
VRNYRLVAQRKQRNASNVSNNPGCAKSREHQSNESSLGGSSNSLSFPATQKRYDVELQDFKTMTRNLIAIRITVTKTSCLDTVVPSCAMSSLKQFILLAILSQTAFSFTLKRIARPQRTSSSSGPSTCSLSFPLQATGDEEGEEFVKVPRRRKRGRLFDNEEEEREFYDRVEERLYSDDEEDEYDEDDDWEDDDDDEEYGLFSNVLIDNPLLDSIDPDGAAERFPELARDPRFWVDIFLFIAFLNFLSAIGPQDYFPDLPWYPDGIQIGTTGT